MPDVFYDNPKKQLEEYLPREIRKRLKDDEKLQDRFDEALRLFSNREIGLEDARRFVTGEIRNLDDLLNHVSEEALDAIKGTLTEITKLVKDIEARLNNTPPDTDIGYLTYKDAIGYFVRMKSKFEFDRGVMLREKRYDGAVVITQVFIDKNNQLILHNNETAKGRKLLLRQIDADLEQYFGIHDVVIVE